MRIFLLTILSFFVLISCSKKQSEEEKETQQTEVMPEEAKNIEQVWATDTVLTTAESVLYDPQNDVLYVSNINGNPTGVDGNGFISKLNTGGEILELEWVTGLDAPKGMGISGGSLFVTDINKVVEIDMNNVEIVNTHIIENAQFLNDITVDNEGNVFISDSNTSTIYQLKEDNIAEWLVIENEKLAGSNGLYYDDAKLMVASFQGNSFGSIDMETKEIQIIAEGVGGGDGVAKTSEGDYLVSDWNGQVFVINNDGEKEKILDTREDEINSADIEFVADQNLLLVPTFFDNRVVAYKINNP